MFFVQTEFTKAISAHSRHRPVGVGLLTIITKAQEPPQFQKSDHLHYVNNNADAPVVHLSAVAHASDDLRRDVVRRADSRRRLRSPLQEPGDAKVCYLELSAFLVGHVQKILWLEITVNDSDTVAVPDSVDYWPDRVTGFLFVVKLFLDDSVEELTTFQ